jgi:hypothetical protein
MLTTADRGFLQSTLQTHRLADALYAEVVFFGQVAKGYLPQVQAYLKTQEWTLAKTVERILKEPDNDAFLEELCQPLATPSA